MNIRTILFSLLVITECIVIVLLGIEVYNTQNNTRTVIIPIQKENLLFSNETKLKNFYEHKPNRIVKDQSGNIIINTINSDTLNERFEYSVEKPKATFRIISLGDSLTYGFGVRTEDNYSEVLEDLLNDGFSCKNFIKFEVINLGLQGYDIEYAAERFRIRGQKYDPDLVLWFIRDGDFYPVELLRAEKEFLRNSNNDLNSQDAFRFAYQTMLEKNSEQEMIAYEMKALYSINKFYKNALLLLLLNITEEQRIVLEDFSHSRVNTYIYDKIRSPSYAEILPEHGHPNKNWHRSFAQGIFAHITERNIIPCDYSL